MFPFPRMSLLCLLQPIPAASSIPVIPQASGKCFLSESLYWGGLASSTLALHQHSLPTAKGTVHPQTLSLLHGRGGVRAGSWLVLRVPSLPPAFAPPAVALSEAPSIWHTPLLENTTPGFPGYPLLAQKTPRLSIVVGSVSPVSPRILATYMFDRCFKKK